MTKDRRELGHGRRSRDRLFRLALIAVFCWAAIGTIAAIALGLALGHADSVNSRATTALTRANAATGKADAALRVQHAQLVQGCVRLNITRGEQNLSNLADFYVDKTVLTFSTAAKRQAPNRRTAKFEAAFLPKLRFAVTHKEWTPLTDCARAVAEKGRSYRAPSPVPFIRRVPLPSQYSIANALRLAPRGSAP